MNTCEAETDRGVRCPKRVSYTLELDGARRRVCGTHARRARLGQVWAWRERPPVEPGPPRHRQPWTVEDDALIVDLEVPTAEVATRLGRTVAAVVLRRSLKTRGLV